MMQALKASPVYYINYEKTYYIKRDSCVYCFGLCSGRTYYASADLAVLDQLPL